MRLFFVTQDFPPETGGIQTYSFEHAKGLAKHVEQVTVIAPDKPGAKAFDAKQHFDTKRLSILNTLLFLPLLFKLPVWAKKMKIDTVVHAQWQTMLPSIMAKKLGRIDQIVVAAHARELLFNPFGDSFLGGIYQKYMRWLLSKADLLLPVSDYTKDLLINLGVDEAKIEVLINGTDPTQFYPLDVSEQKKAMELENKFVILTVTRMVERKGIDTVIEALSVLKDQIPEFAYLVVGDGPDRSKLEQLARTKKVDKLVTFCGKVPYDELNTYYNLGDVFVMPSKTATPDVEGFGIVFLEANACAKPVIGTYSGGIPSAIIHEKTGLLVEENNPKELSQAILRLYKNQELAKEYGTQGLLRIKEEANWDALSTQLYHHLQQLK
ncbi:MAG: glycosyltransferase family 4 protein [Balneolaceae bacterium]|nr:glycosyltransferase family 4 protein [Balneolaceae bacterium]